MAGYMVIDTETSIQYKTVQVKGKDKRVPDTHGPSWKDPHNDIYTIIYGSNPKNIKLIHNGDGFNRRLPEPVTTMLKESHTLIGVNLKFDLGYIWHDPNFQQWLKDGGQIWDCQLVLYLLSGQRHAFPSLAEMQKLYLGHKTKSAGISALFKRCVGADEIIARKGERKNWWKVYEHYCYQDGSSPMLIMQKQYKEAKAKGLLPIIKLYNEYLLAITMIETNGLHIDIPAAETRLQEFTFAMLENLKQAEELAKQYWDDSRLPVMNLQSTQHASVILFGGELSCRVKRGTGVIIKTGPNAGKEQTRFVQETVTLKGFGLNGEEHSNLTKFGFYQTGEDVINHIYSKSKNEIAKQYCRYRKIATGYKQKISTYINAFLYKSIDGVVYPNYNNTETVTSRLSSSGPNCVDGETEVLTPNGWVSFRDLRCSQMVLQVDPLTYEANFTIPEKLHTMAHEGDMVRVSSEWGEFLYTGEHRLLSYTRDTNKIVEPASSWAAKWHKPNTIIDRQCLRGAYNIGGKALGGEGLLNLKIAIMIQAEGTYHGTYYSVRLSSDRKQGQLKELFNTWHQEKNGRIRVKIPIEQVSEWLCGTKVKNFTSAILSYNIQTQEIFIQEAFKWDGDFTRNNTYAQKNIRGQSVDIVQAVASLIGYSTSRYSHPNKDLDVVNICHKILRHQSRTTIDTVTYKGDVYCVTVPTGFFMIRRKGTVLVTGNCQNFPKHGEFYKLIQGLIVSPKGWTCCQIDFSQLETYCRALLTQEPALIADLQSGVDFHVQNMSWGYGLTYEEGYRLAKIDEIPEWKEKRSGAKAVTFGEAYGQMPDSMAVRTGWPVDVIEKIYANMYENYPGLIEFDKKVNREVQRSARVSRKDDLPAKMTKGNVGKGGMSRRFNGSMELLPIRSRDKKSYSYDWDEPRHVGFYQSPTGKLYAFEEFGSTTKYGEIFRYYRPTQMKNYGMQGCIHGDTKIFTDRGMFKIKDLENKDNIKVWTDGGYSRANCRPSGLKAQYKITFKDGNTIACSPEHKFRYVNPSTLFEGWISAQEILNKKQNGKRVAIKLGQEIEFSGPALLPDPKFHNRPPNFKYVSVNTIGNYYEIGLVLGRIASDGYIRKNKGVRLIIAEHEESILAVLKPICAKIGVYRHTTKLRQGRVQKLHYLDFDSSCLAEQLSGIKTNILPQCWLNKDLMRGYLSGMFDGDGHVTPGGLVSLTFGKQAHKLNWANEIQMALRLFGIRSRVRHYPNLRTNVSVMKADTHLFKDKIGFINKIKQTKIIDTKTNRKRCNITYVESVINTGLKVEMFDIVDSDNKTFCANGVVTHNTAGDIQAMTTAAMFKFLLDNPDKVKIVNEIHDSKWFVIKDEYITCIVPKLCAIMCNVRQLLESRFDIKIDFDFKVDCEIGPNFAELTTYKLD